MSLPAGTRLGVYEIVGMLGAGGMGEVYRARDTKLGREVALKLLPEAFAADPDRLARFEREAQALAALNHPNIATLYGFDERALVMELVEGQTLDEQIRSHAERRPSTVELLEWALPVARQIAEGLETAHEQGIIHRDLKPANVKVRTDGTVKILDFGLAKAMSPDVLRAVQDPQNSPTITAHGTKMGMILGTAAYMAPEQAKGKPVDKRADIWAFGVVLYEMLTGRRAFDGEDVSTTLAAVLMKDPEWGSLPSDTPPALRILIRRCLERDPRIRLRDIGEARVLLSQTDAWRTQPAATAPVVSASRHTVFWIAIAASVVAAAAIGAWASRTWQPAPPEPVRVRMTVSGEQTGPAGATGLSLSPDGKYLTFVALQPTSGLNVIWVHPLGEQKARAVPGTEGASGAFWSPDSRQLGFAAGGQLRTVDPGGGLPRAICELAGTFSGATWHPDGTILFGHGTSLTSQRLARVSQAGGTVTAVKPDEASGETGFAFPVFLPGGRRYLYLAWSPLSDKRALYAGSLDGGPPTFILQTDSSVSYAEPGWLLFLRESTLFAQRFDADALRLSGEPLRIADTVMSNRQIGRAGVSVSNTGVLAFREGAAIDLLSQLTWFSRSGKQLGTIGDVRPYGQVRLSPDERRVAVSLPHERTVSSIWTMELGNQILTQLTSDQLASDPVWSPDSQAVAFEAAPKGRRDFYRQVVGTQSATMIYESAEDPKWIDDWSRDGRFLLFHLPRPGKLYAVAPDERPAKPILLAESTAVVDGAHFSPDGKWVAYQLRDTGEFEVWVAAFPAFNHRQRVSAKGGGQAFFRGDGKELFFLTPDGKMMSAAVVPPAKPGGPLELRTPVELFQGPIARPTLGVDQYSVTGDGQRFLFLAPRQDRSSTSPITVIVNWTTGLGR